MDPPKTIGRYRLTGELGRGGMGVVYRADDPELGRPVAVKVILFPPQAGDRMRGELEARFRREARAAAGIRHPGVVTVHDAGRDGEYLFLVMELIDGESLAERLRKRKVLPRAQACEIAAQVADALAAAHAQGVVHRDVTPRNILLARDGRVVVTDFGIARSFGDDTAELTRSGAVLGSPSYVAPEQARGQSVDQRTDIFSLGVVLFEMLVGRRPFAASDVTSVLYQIVHEDPLAAAEVRGALGLEAHALLARCLAKSPDDRLQDASELAREARRLGAGATAYEEAQVGIETEALPPTAFLGREEPPRPERRFSWAAVAGGALAVVLAAVLAWLQWPSAVAPAGEDGPALPPPPAAVAEPPPAEAEAAATLDEPVLRDAVVPEETALPDSAPPPDSRAVEARRTETADLGGATTGSAAAAGTDPGEPPAPGPRDAAPAAGEPAAGEPAAGEPETGEATPDALASGGPVEPADVLASDAGETAPPDTVAPVLAIDDPPASLTEALIVLGGRVLDDRGAVALTVDGAAVEVGEGGRFTVRRDLEPGRNVLTFVAADEAGNRTVKSIEVAPSGAAASTAVSGEPAGPPRPAGPARFADRGDGTVIDTRVGLMWGKKGDGQSHRFQDAKQYCKRLKLGDHRDWRLPRIEELEELSQASRSPGSGLSPVRLPEPVWSSTKEGAAVWAFDFAQGRRAEGSADAELRVLCVRRLPQRRDRPPVEPGFPGGPERGPPAQRGPGGG